MKKSIIVLSLLGVGLFISSCGGSGTSNSSVNSESNSITSDDLTPPTAFIVRM